MKTRHGHISSKMIHTVVRSCINLAIDKQGNGLAHKFDLVEARYENCTPVCQVANVSLGNYEEHHRICLHQKEINI